MNRVLADGDAVIVVELFLLHRLPVHESPVGAAKVHDPELLTAPFHPCVMAARRGIAKDEVVVWRTAHAKRVLGGSVRVPGIGT
jgi:hypothetical protein